MVFYYDTEFACDRLLPVYTHEADVSSHVKPDMR